MQKLCRKSGCGVCIGCDNPDNLLCQKQVEEIVEYLRLIITEFVPIETVEDFMDISKKEAKKLLNIQ